MEEDEGKEETEASSKAEGKAEGEDKEAKEGEEGAAAGKSDDKEGKKDTDMVKQNEAGEITWLPREALQCHMCGLSKFPDIKSYMRHLESRRHETLKYSFHAKGAAILHFLRANSKLASQRKMLKSLRRGIKGPIMRCRKCQCEVFGYIREHAKTVEHIALRNYLRVVCCNTTFFNRADLEEHRLSLTHLKNQLEEGQKMEAESEVEDIGVEESEEGKLFADTIKHMKQKTKFSEVTSPENLMPYDPATPQGLNFIWKRSHYRCKACPQVRLTSAADTEEHFKSLDHYNNLMAHLKAIEQEKEKKRLEEEEAARKAELERKKKEEAEAKAAEEGKGGEGEENKEEKEVEDKEKSEQEAEKEENEDSKKNGDMEGEEDEDLEEEEEEEEAMAAARTGEEEEEEEDTSFNFEEDMHNMETVDEACDDGEIEGGLEGSLAEEGVGKEDSVGGVTTDPLFAEISCLAEVGEELDDEVMEKIEPKEEKVEVEAEAEAEAEEVKVKVETKPVVEEVKTKAKPKAAVKKEAEEPVESVKKEAVKREREEDEEPAATVAVEAKGRGRGATTPRGRRGRGRGRARSAKN